MLTYVKCFAVGQVLHVKGPVSIQIKLHVRLEGVQGQLVQPPPPMTLTFDLLGQNLQMTQLLINPLPDFPILGTSNLAVNKDMMY